MTLGHWSKVLPRETARQCGGPIHPIWHNVPGVACLNLLQVAVGKCMFMACQGSALMPLGNCQFGKGNITKGDTRLKN